MIRRSLLVPVVLVPVALALAGASAAGIDDNWPRCRGRQATLTADDPGVAKSPAAR